MEATIRIPLGEYLATEELDRFISQCAERKQTAESRITQLIREDIEEEPDTEEAK